MSRLFKRAFSSLPPRANASPSLPPTLFASAPSVNRTLPMAVKRHRQMYPAPAISSPSPLSDPLLHDPASGKKFPAALEKDYRDLLRRTIFDSSLSDADLRAKYLKTSSEWRARVRGYAPRGRKGKHAFFRKKMGGEIIPTGAAEGDVAAGAEKQTGDEIVGHRIYLPNIQIRLVRNYTPPGEPYDPYIATFRIPPSMNKLDLRSYLIAVYGLEVTFIRTDNYIAPVGRLLTGRLKRLSGRGLTYKRAVVGLHEPFHYPDDAEELYAQGERNGTGDEMANIKKKWLTDNFNPTMSERMRERALFKYYKGSRWRAKTHSNAGVTVKEIMKRRKEREAAVAEAVKMRYAGLGNNGVAASV